MEKIKILIFLVVLIINLMIFDITLAGYKPPFGGEYTNLCGSRDASFYNCQARCNINEGWCETINGSIFVAVCDGKTNWCFPPNFNGPLRGRQFLTSFAAVGSNKTVTMVVEIPGSFCMPGANPNIPCVVGWIVWWSGAPSLRPPVVITLPSVVTN